jgi:hypothetical protein
VIIGKTGMLNDMVKAEIAEIGIGHIKMTQLQSHPLIPNAEISASSKKKGGVNPAAGNQSAVGRIGIDMGELLYAAVKMIDDGRIL